MDQTYWMCDILKRIHYAVSIIITWIDTPFVSSMWVWSKLKAESIHTIRHRYPCGIMWNQTHMFIPLFGTQWGRTYCSYRSACLASFEVWLFLLRKRRVSYPQKVSVILKLVCLSKDCSISSPCTLLFHQVSTSK